MEIAAFIESHLAAAEHIDFLGLAALDDLASSLAEAGAGGARRKVRANEMAERQGLASSIAAGLGSETPPPEAPAQPSLTPRAGSPLAIATPAFTPAIVAPAPMFTPTLVHATPTPPGSPAAAAVAPVAAALPTHALDSASASLIESSIAALDALDQNPFVERAEWPEDALVAIDTLTYRGRAALDRAIELREEMRAARSGPSREVLDELFDLLELARAE
jgi:hypothetical protein